MVGGRICGTTLLTGSGRSRAGILLIPCLANRKTRHVVAGMHSVLWCVWVACVSRACVCLVLAIA